MKMTRIKLFLFALLLLIPIQTMTAKAAPVAQIDITNIFVNMQKVYLSQFDKVCIKGSLDGIPLGMISLQPTLKRMDTVVLSLDGGSETTGYFIHLEGPFAKVQRRTKQGTWESLPSPDRVRVPSKELWAIPAFDSVFTVGDFVPSLLLQMRFTASTEEFLRDGVYRLKSRLIAAKVGDKLEPRELLLYVNAKTSLPGGFDINGGEGAHRKRRRAVKLLAYDRYAAKSFAKHVEATDDVTGRKSVFKIDWIRPLRTDIPLPELSRLNSQGWQNLCSN